METPMPSAGKERHRSEHGFVAVGLAMEGMRARVAFAYMGSDPRHLGPTLYVSEIMPSQCRGA